MLGWLGRAVLVCALAVAGVALVPGESAPARAAGISGVVRVASDSSLNVRTGPATTYPVVSRLGPGASAAIACQVGGITEAGSVRTTAIWDRLTDGHYVSDAFIA